MNDGLFPLREKFIVSRTVTDGRTKSSWAKCLLQRGPGGCPHLSKSQECPAGTAPPHRRRSQLARVDGATWEWSPGEVGFASISDQLADAFSAWQRHKQKLEVDYISEVPTLEERKPRGNYFIIRRRLSGGFQLKGILSSTSLGPFFPLLLFLLLFFKFYKLWDLTVEIP